MSKRRLVITAVLAGASQSEVARKYHVSQGWISRLLARYKIEGEAVFEAGFRRPRTSPNAIPPGTVELILTLRKQLVEAGHDAGAETIGWQLRHGHQITVSRATIHRILTRHAAVTPDPSKRGRLRHIGIGRTHAGTDIKLLVQDLDVRIVNAATGEILREQVIDPARDYHGTGRPPGPAPKKQ